MSFYFKVFFVCRTLFENRKPYLFSFTSLRIMSIYFCTLSLFQWSFRTHFPLGLYSRLKKEQMHEELQQKLDCDEHIKEIQSQLEENLSNLKNCRLNFTAQKSKSVRGNER